MTKICEKQRVRLGYEIHVEAIAISTDSLGHTQRESISTRNSIAIINHFLLNTLNYFIIATKTYLCLYVSILWSDLESSRMCLWNKIPIPLFGARSNVYHPWTCLSEKLGSLWYMYFFFLSRYEDIKRIVNW